RRDREEGRGGPRGGGPNGERDPAQGRVVHPLRPQRGRAHQAGRESGRDAYLRAGRARAPRAAVHEDYLARAGGHLMGSTFTGSPRLAAAARTATFTGSPRLRLRLAHWPRDVQRLALPFTGSPWTAGPQPRDVQRLALPFTGPPWTAGPQPRDVQRLALPFTGSPWTAGPQPRDVQRLALP